MLLGGSGLLGSVLVPHLRQEGAAVDAPHHHEVDLRDDQQLRARIKELRPHLLVNAAAQSNVDQAERDPDHAFAVNAIGAHNAALGAAEAGIPLLHLSTDYVFDGQRRRPYRELHPTGEPPNQYGRSKLQGELLVRACCPRHFIVRVAALFGDGARPDFVDWVLEEARPEAPLRIVADRFVSPTRIEELARQLSLLLRTPFYGTYHATGHGAASWFELARSALLLAGRDPLGVLPVPDLELAGGAPRAAYTALENHLLRLRGLDVMSHWRDALATLLGADPS